MAAKTPPAIATADPSEKSEKKKNTKEYILKLQLVLIHNHHFNSHN